jgi:hypothetical protein
MMLKVQMETEAGNRAIQDGSLPEAIQQTMGSLRPEAAYFFPEDGLRTALFFFEMAEPSQIVVVAEPFFMGLNAKVTFVPVMNADDLQKGLGSLQPPAA